MLPNQDEKESKIYSKCTGHIIKIKEGNLKNITKRTLQTIIKKN